MEIEEIVKPEKRKLKTEDTGKIFEMAICMALNIPYDGRYKYSTEEATRIKTKLVNGGFIDICPPLIHTAKKGARYDFTSISDPAIHLSAKTTKKGGGKVAPQVIGQGQPIKLCEVLGILFEDVPTLKRYIQENIHTILPVMMEHTFDCPNIFYNAEKDTIQYITFMTPIDWTSYEFIWTCNSENWANSSTLKLKDGVALLEVQFHTKSRTNMAIRWYYTNFLQTFKDHFKIIII